jgi:hypothetical protein
MGERIYIPKTIDVDGMFMLPDAFELLVPTFVLIYLTHFQTIITFQLF